MKIFNWFRVSGQSMEPYARAGDFIFARQLFPWEKYADGDVVIARDPRNSSRLLLKRISACDNGQYFLKGDNARSSTDSRTFGAVTKGSIAGKIFLLI